MRHHGVFHLAARRQRVGHTVLLHRHHQPRHLAARLLAHQVKRDQPPPDRALALPGHRGNLRHRPPRQPYQPQQPPLAPTPRPQPAQGLQCHQILGHGGNLQPLRTQPDCHPQTPCTHRQNSRENPARTQPIFPRPSPPFPRPTSSLPIVMGRGSGCAVGKHTYPHAQHVPSPRHGGGLGWGRPPQKHPRPPKTNN